MVKSRRAFCRAFDQFYFLSGQTIEVIHESVDLLVGCGDLRFEEPKGFGIVFVRLLLVQLNHSLYHRNHLVVVGYIIGIVEVNRTDRETFAISYKDLLEPHLKLIKKPLLMIKVDQLRIQKPQNVLKRYFVIM